MSRALDQCDKRAHIKNKKLVKLLLNLSKQTFYNFKWGSANDEWFKRNIDDIKRFPHIFVLNCIMDRGIKAEKAWAITYKVGNLIGGLHFKHFSNISLEKCKKIFREQKLHRYIERMSIYFFEAIQIIKNKYNGDAARIWNDVADSATLINRFKEFYGVGVKISTMATNILLRLKIIELKDCSDLDISPDTHVMTMFKRMGLIDEKDVQKTIKISRKIYPRFPGILDIFTFLNGRDICKSPKPICSECKLCEYCPKIDVKYHDVRKTPTN